MAAKKTLEDVGGNMTAKLMCVCGKSHKCLEEKFIKFALREQAKQIETEILQWAKMWYEASSQDPEMKGYTCFQELKQILKKRTK